MTVTNKVSTPRTLPSDLTSRSAGPDAFAALGLALTGRAPLPSALRGVEQALATDSSAEAKLGEMLSGLPPEALGELQQLAKQDGLGGVTAVTAVLLTQSASSSFANGPAQSTQASAPAVAPTKTKDGLGWSDSAEVGGAGAFHTPRPTQEVMGQLAAGGLQVDPQRISSDVIVTTQAEMTLRELTATAFGIPASEVSDNHYALLVKSNPKIGEALALAGTPDLPLPVGTPVSLATTPMGLEMRLNTTKDRQSTVDALLQQAQGSNPPKQATFNQPQLINMAVMRAQLAQQVATYENARSQAVGADALGRAQARGGAVPPEFNQYVESLNKAGTPQATQQARTLQVQQAMELSKTFEGKGANALVKGDLEGAKKLFDEARAAAVKGLSLPGITATEKTALLERKASLYLSEAGAMAQSLKLPSLAVKDEKEPPEADKKKVEDIRNQINQRVDSAKTEFTALATDLKNQGQAAGPQGKAFADYGAHLDQLAQSCDTERHNLLAVASGRAEDSKAAAGDYRNALGVALGMPKQELDAALDPDVHDKIMGDGSYMQWFNPEDWFQDAVGAEQKVSRLSEAKVKALSEKIAALPEEKRGMALDALAQWGTTASSIPDANVLAMVSQVLMDVSNRVKDPLLATQAQGAHGTFLLQLNNGEGALYAYNHMKELAQKLPDEKARKQLLSEAVMGQVQAQSVLGAGMEWKLKKPAAAAIHQMRLEMEKPGSPMPKEMVVRIIMQEMATNLDAHQSEAAQACLDYLRKNYVKDLPWLKDALNRWEKENKNGGGTAALQVFMRELVGENMTEAMLGWTIGAAACFAVLPFLGWGAIIGGAVATAALKARNISRGSNGIMQAYKTGLNNETLRTSINDAIFFSFDAISMAAPFKSIRGLGRQSMQTFANGAKGKLTPTAYREGKKEMFAAANKIGQEKAWKEATEYATQLLQKQGLPQPPADLVKHYAQQRITQESRKYVPRAMRDHATPAMLKAAEAKYFRRTGRQAVSRESWRWFNYAQIPSMLLGLGIPLALMPSMMREMMPKQKNIAAPDEAYNKQQMEAQEAQAKAQADAADKQLDLQQQQLAAMDPAFAPAQQDGAPVLPEQAQAETAQRIQGMFPGVPPQTKIVDPKQLADFVAYRQEIMGQQSLPPQIAQQMNSRLGAFGQNGAALFDPLTSDVLLNRETLGNPGAQQAMQQELARQTLHSLPPEQFQAVVSEVMKDPAFAELAKTFVKSNPQAANYSGPQLVDEILTQALVAGGSPSLTKGDAVTKAGLSQAPAIPTA
ncbi:MAG: hypothetical protein ACT4TC_19770 [Myxococcaceae bacterium]